MARQEQIIGELGSPVRAGIDRCFLPSPLMLDRFPRTRGDRPHGLLPITDLQQVPPYARG